MGEIVSTARSKPTKKNLKKENSFEEHLDEVFYTSHIKRYICFVVRILVAHCKVDKGMAYILSVKHVVKHVM